MIGGHRGVAFRDPQIAAPARLVILNVPHPKCGAREIRRWRQMRKSWYIAFFQLPWLPEKLLGAQRCGSRWSRRFASRRSIRHRFDACDAGTLSRGRRLDAYALTAMLELLPRAHPPARCARDWGRNGRCAHAGSLGGAGRIALGIHCLDGLDAYVPDLTVKRFPRRLALGAAGCARCEVNDGAARIGSRD